MGPVKSKDRYMLPRNPQTQLWMGPDVLQSHGLGKSAFTKIARERLGPER
jgi:hypothetical protein